MSQGENQGKRGRSHTRSTLYLEAEYQVMSPEADSPTILFETENIGAGGLMFYSYDQLDIGNQLEVQLHLEFVQIQFAAEVVWVKKWFNPGNARTIYAIGLAYTQLSSETLSIINDMTTNIVLLQRSIREK